MQHSAILLDIRSAHNVGAIFRTADGAGVSHLYLCGHTPTPIDRFGRMRPDIKKTSLGASNTVSWSYHANANHLLSHIRTAAPDTDIVAVERTVDAIALRELPHDTVRPRIYIFGNEVTGVPAAVLQQSHYVVALPMQGTKESLNVATTAGIVLYDALVR